MNNNQQEKIDASFIAGKNILERIIACDSTLGGVLGAITGSQGSGKTGMMLGLSEILLQKHPEQKIFWSISYDSPMQILKLTDGKWNILVQRDCPVKFYDRDNDMAEVNLPVTHFGTYKECYEKAKTGVVNCVFFKRRESWMTFISFLRRAIPQWKHVFLDDIAEILPNLPSGRRYHLQTKFLTDLVEIRKSLMNVFYNTQVGTDVDYRIRGKTMLFMLLPGSKHISGKRVTQKAINALKKDVVHGNEAWVECDGSFGKIRLTTIYKPIKGRNIQASLPSDYESYDKEIEAIYEGENKV